MAALGVSEDQRRGAALAGLVAALEEGVEVGREVVRLTEHLRPSIGDARERRVQRVARLVDEARERGVEVPVLALAEAVAPHVDRRAELRVVGVGGGELLAFLGRVDGRRLCEAGLVEARLDGRPVEFGDAVGYGQRCCCVHALPTLAAGKT